MVRVIGTDYDSPITVGTRQDDGRLGDESLFIQTTSEASSRVVLSRDQTLSLVTALVATLREIENG